MLDSWSNVCDDIWLVERSDFSAKTSEGKSE